MSAPRLPDALLAEFGWELARTESELALELPFFSIEAFNAIYVESASVDAYDAIADPRVDLAGRAFFTTDLVFDPSLDSFGIDPASVFGIATSYAEREFKESIEADGLTAVETVEERDFDRGDGRPARAFCYDVAYPLSDDVIEQDVVDGQFTLPSTLWACIWPTRGAYAMAGGMYPTEEFADAILRQASGARLAVDVEVDPDPERDRARVFEAMRRVE
ncbi:hypothetical protein [Haloarchaeobius litoreus]|uniref:Uncharacterized protein n=1 Tax=Haloarchaeobius litoreus TaxID=755306 RepID=A0ABD6DJI2_9EURY|nr:hypothetical protein [Haloarchaeobius litoreus]